MTRQERQSRIVDMLTLHGLQRQPDDGLYPAPTYPASRRAIQSWSGWFSNRHARRGPAITLR